MAYYQTTVWDFSTFVRVSILRCFQLEGHPYRCEFSEALLVLFDHWWFVRRVVSEMLLPLLHLP